MQNNIAQTPKTLEIPQVDRTENFTNNTQNPLASSNKSLNNKKSKTLQNQKLSSKESGNISRHHSHENIKRVPYIKNFD